MSQTEKAVSVSACPVCGQPFGSFQTKCSSCGLELNSPQRDQEVENFFKKLEEISQREYETNKKQGGKKEKRKQSKALVVCEVVAIVSIILIILHATGINAILRIIPLLLLG